MPFENSLKTYQKYFLDLTWAHWNRLGATGFGAKNLCSVDPEALLLLTAFLGKEEGRLLKLMGEWIHQYGHLLSIERLKTLLRFCELDSAEVETQEAKTVFKQAREVLRKVALEVVPKSQASRWKKIFPIAFHFSPEIPSKRIKETNFVVQQNALIKLRYLFGPGTRADILYFILVITNQEKNPFHLEISPPVIARSLEYNMSSIHRTLSDFESAALLKRTSVNKKRIRYLLNRPILENQKILEKCFIKWFPIVEMVYFLERLRRSLQTRPCDESIVKSRLLKYINFCHEFARKSFIPIKSEASMDDPLKDISLEIIYKRGEGLIREVCDFVTSDHW